MSDTFKQIKRFNDVFGLNRFSRPTGLGVRRLQDFMSILSEELAEGEEIRDLYQKIGDESPMREDELEILTEMADWLADLVVYCLSEGYRWGLPMEEVLDAVMKSNFSKLDDDGKPVFDERGKVLKGKNFVAPETMIKGILK